MINIGDVLVLDNCGVTQYYHVVEICDNDSDTIIVRLYDYDLYDNGYKKELKLSRNMLYQEKIEYIYI